MATVKPASESYACVKKLLVPNLGKLGILNFLPHRHVERLTRSPLVARFMRGTLWSFAGAVISRSLTLIGFILVARLLGKEEFGKLGIIQVTVAMFQIFAGFGLGLTATKYVSELRTTDPERTGRIVALSLVVASVFGAVLSVALIVFARPIAIRTLGSPELVPILRISSLLLFFLALNGYQTGTLAGLERFQTIAKINLFSGSLSLIVLVLGTYSSGLKGAVWALVFGAFLNWAITQRSLRTQLQQAGISLDYKQCFREMAILRGFSLPTILAAAMVVPVNWVCSAMLVRTANGYAQMGIYNAMNQWFSALLFLPTVLEQVTLPMISERLGARDHQRSRKLLITSILVNAAIVAPLVVVGGFASPLIVRFYGQAFRGSEKVLIVVLLTAGLYAIQTPVGQLVAACNRMWLGFLMNAGWAVAMLVATDKLIYRGAVGLALARLMAYVVHSLWTFGFANHFMSSERHATAEDSAVSAHA